MIAICKNNVIRLWQITARVLLMFFLMFVAIGAAIFMSTYESKLSIGVIGNTPYDAAADSAFEIHQLSDVPPITELVKGTYDAVVTYKGGEPQVLTLKNETFQQEVLTMLKNDGVSQSTNQTSGVGRNILGFLMMFFLMSAVTTMFIFNEDKEKHIMERITAAPLSFSKVLGAHSLTTFILLLVPSLLFIFVAKVIFKSDIGFSMLEYTLLLSVLGLFGTAFSLCNAAMFFEGDQANMLGSMLVMMTTMISGSFFSFEGGNKWLDAIINWLPQKKYLDLVTGLEKGETGLDIWLPLCYIGGLTLLLYMAAVIKTRKDYIQR